MNCNTSVAYKSVKPLLFFFHIIHLFFIQLIQTRVGNGDGDGDILERFDLSCNEKQLIFVCCDRPKCSLHLKSFQFRKELKSYV